MKKNIEDNEDSRFWKFIDKHSYLIGFITITILAILVRLLLLKYKSGDYEIFLKPWFDELKSNGGLFGLSKNIGNYTPPYMTLLALLTYIPVDSLLSIKILSIIFDFIGAVALKKIIEELLNDKKYKEQISLLGYSLYLFLPTVFLNSAYWAQCDQIYTAFVLISILYLIKNNFKKSIIFWSIAFAFKFQAILIFPLYILYFIQNRKIKFRYFIYIPLVLFICGLPKIIFTQNIFSCFEMYFNQANTYKQYITLNFPNFYSIFLTGSESNNPNLIFTPFEELGTIGIIITFTILLLLAYFIYIKKIKFDKYAIIEFGLLSILITTFFLPQMHERYLFMGDVLGIVYLIINKKNFWIPIGIEIISLNGYMYLLFSGFAINISILSIFFFILLIYYSKEIINKYFINTR